MRATIIFDVIDGPRANTQPSELLFVIGTQMNIDHADASYIAEHIKDILKDRLIIVRGYRVEIEE